MTEVMGLNPGLDPAALAQRFQPRGRLVIADLFPEALAGRLHDCLAREVPWGLACHDGGSPVVHDAARLAAMPEAERHGLEARINAQAVSGFQYRYQCYPMVDAYLQGRDPHLLLHRLFEFINSPPMLDFVRTVTGRSQIVRADAQATLYTPGDFLTLHNDFDAAKGRLVAYVMGFTRHWRADYGGVLQFLDQEQNIEQGFLPRYNSMMLFSVPQNHAVSCVAPFAPRGRFAITGWFQDATAVPARTRARYGL